MCDYTPTGMVVDGPWMVLFPLGIVLSIALMAGMMGFLGHWLLQQSKANWTSVSRPAAYHFLTGEGRGEPTMADDRAFAFCDEQRTPPRGAQRPHGPLKWELNPATLPEDIDN